MRSFIRKAALASLGGLAILGVVASAGPACDVLVGEAVAAPARSGKRAPATRDFEYELSDCLEADRRDSVGLIVSDDAVLFDHVFTMNCIAATRPSTVKVRYAKKGRLLEVSVDLQSPVLSDCTCPIGIHGKISNLKRGTYRLSFAYQFKSGDSDQATRQSLGGKEFTIE